MQINIELFYKLILSFLVCVTRHNQNTQNKKVDFLAADKHKSILQDDSITLGVYSQVCKATSTQSNKFAISLQYFQNCIGDEADFLPADEHKSLLQDDSITLGVYSQVCPKYPKQQVCNIFAISPEMHRGRS